MSRACFSKVLMFGFIVVTFSMSCNFRTKAKSLVDTVDAIDPDLSQLGAKAFGADETILTTVRDVTTSIAPAAVRPDPDLYAKRLLKQYRSDGVVMAREIGGTEPFRALLGGASEDFKTSPQETYDATSLLANQKVAEDVCEALVAPNSSEHPGWQTVLPGAAREVDANLKFLAQRFLGKPSSDISQDVIDALTEIVNTAANGAQVSFTHYIPACVMLSMDAEALLL